MRLITIGFAAFGMALVSLTAQAQPAPLRDDSVAAAVMAAAATATTDAPPATLSYANRDIVLFRASVLSRPPAERAAATVQLLDRLVEESPAARVGTVPVGNTVAVMVGTRVVFFILPADVSTLSGETVAQVASDAAAELQRAFDETVELRSPGKLVRAGLTSVGATFLFAGALWIVYRLRRRGRRRLNLTTERRLTRLSRTAEVVRAARVPQLLERAFDLVVALVALFLTYWWFTFVFRRFPYTRPWGETLRATLIGTAESVALAVLHALPNLFSVLAVILVTRLIVRLVGAFFSAVEHGHVSVPWMYPETAQPTRRITTGLLWLLALVVAYPFVPGSGSEAFKGVSVFAGLMISLGSSGIMNQIMSGLTLTYSRAVRVGDFVKVGDVEGTVQQLGVLSLKITTPRFEDITIPNAIVVSASTTNYSRYADTHGVRVPTSITIGYDTPWRQVEALLLLAASRTDGVRTHPTPVVRKSELLDFYVQYTLLVCLDAPNKRGEVLGVLHANILDTFNEYGVQITSPNYEADPAEAKVVPPERWYAAPAVPSGEEV